MNFLRQQAPPPPHGVRAEEPVPETVRPQVRVTRDRTLVRAAVSDPVSRAVRARSTEYAIINVSKLNAFEDGETVNLEALMNKGIIRKANDGLKVLGNGEITKKLTVEASVFSATAKEKIEAAGGKTEVI